MTLKPSGASYGTLHPSEIPLMDDKKSKIKDGDNPNCAARFFRFWFPEGCTAELTTLLSLGWPTILTLLSRFMMQSVSIIMCGHLSKYELSAAALANSLINVLGLNIGGGMATACDTLFSQTFGSSNKKGMGIFLQRAFLCEYAILIILYCIHLNTEPLLVLLKQNPVIARMAQEYVTIFMPGLFFDFTFMILSRYLQCQNCVFPPMLCAIGGSVCNAVSQYIAIFVLGFRFRASAFCQMASFGVMTISIITYTLVSKVYKDTWDGIDVKSALCSWGLFYKYAIPGMLLIGLEAWSYEIATIVAGTIDAVQLGVQAIIFQFDMWGFLVPFSMSIAVNIRIGQELGSGSPSGAKHVYRIGISTILVLATSVAILIISLRDYLPRIFSNDVNIVALTSKILPIFALFVYFDGIAHISSGALRGCGKQIFCAVSTFIGFYVVGMPIGVPLTLLTTLKVYGMWIGLCCGVSIEALLNTVMVLRMNWEAESEKAMENAYSTSSNDYDSGNGGAEKDKDSTPSNLVDKSDSERRLLQLQKKSKPLSVRKIIRKTNKEVDVKKEFCYRLIFAIILALLLTGAILIRIYLPRPWRDWCMPFGNSTIVHNISDYRCVMSMREGLRSRTILHKT